MLRVKTLQVWDSNENPQTKGFHSTLLWQSYNEERIGLISIPKLVEINAANLRSKYLQIISLIGEHFLDDRKIIDHFKLNDDFNFWWTTRLVEKSYGKSGQIANAIKFIAFQQWVRDYEIEDLYLVTDNPALIKAINIWGVKNNVRVYCNIALVNKVTSFKLTGHLKFLLLILRALLTLAHYIWDRRALIGTGLRKWSKSKGRLIFFSYFLNFRLNSKIRNVFLSSYWGEIPKLLCEKKTHSNWLHIYVKSELLPSAKDAARAICDLNLNATHESHVTLDSFISYIAVKDSLKEWIKVLRIGLRLTPKIEDCKNFSEIWGFFQDDWLQSIFGWDGLKNIFDFILLKNALNRLPLQLRGVYLQENQAWEMALISAWNLCGHREIIGHPHSSVRFWDLRYFFDSQCYRGAYDNLPPMPDKVALNGDSAVKAYIDGGFPVEKILEVEAMRYLYLGKKKGRIKGENLVEHHSKSLNVLVLCDYHKENTFLQLRLLEESIQFLSEDFNFFLRAHPISPVDPADFPNLKIKITTEPLEDLMGKCSIAYTSSVTSASVDAYVYGLHVISVLDPKNLNLSPLIGCTGVTFVSSPSELAKGLMGAADSFLERDECRLNYFNLSQNITGWKSLLNDFI
jgi:surface carbohydrate biosynthesis protein (TIGR04326 family)